MNPTTSTGGIISLIKSLNIPGILDGTQKTLSVINQAIPVIYQVKPLVSNLGTIFKIKDIINDTNDNNNNNNNEKKYEKKETNNSPIFFV